MKRQVFKVESRRFTRETTGQRVRLKQTRLISFSVSDGCGAKKHRRTYKYIFSLKLNQ